MKSGNLNGQINVLIPDGEKLLSMHIINCLSEIKDLKIHVLSKFEWVEIRFSRKIASFTSYTNIYLEKEWVKIIKSEILMKKINVLFPVHVENIRICTRFKKEFNSILPKLIVPSTKYFDIANNKWDLHKLLEKNNLSRPNTIHSNSINKINQKKIDYPILVKPLEGMGGLGIKKILNEEGLLDHSDHNSNFILQSFVNGYDIDMSVLCENGKILAYSIQKGYINMASPYQPYLGIEFLFEKKIFAIVEKLVHKLIWTGVAHVDLRYDEDEKIFKVIEINPRFWGSVEASKKVGVNFPYLYCLTSLGVNYDFPEYRFEKYVNNRGFIKILKSKFSLSKTNYKIPKFNSLKYDLVDPMPKLYKYTIKLLKKIFPKKSKFLQKYKYEVY